MAKLSYSEKLKDPRWQRKRLERLQESEFSCDCCLSEDKTLHVHHKFYKKNAEPWEYENHELEVLCEDCHDYRHWILDQLKTMISDLPLDEMEATLGYLQGKSFWFNEDPQDHKMPKNLHNFASGFSDALNLPFLSVLPFITERNINFDGVKKIIGERSESEGFKGFKGRSQ